MKKYTVIFLVLLFSISLFGCSKKSEFSTHTFFAMNTFVTVSAEKTEDFQYIEDYIKEAEELFSKTLPSSEISLLNERKELKLSPIVRSVIEKSVEIGKKTNGAFDVTVGALVDLWDITGGNNAVPDQKDIDIARKKCGFGNIIIEDNKVSLENQVKLDLGGVVKGLYTQKTLDLFKEKGVTNACISLGGNIGVIGSSENNLKKQQNGWNVGIKNPDDINSIIGYINVTDTTVAVSGDYERFFEKQTKRYHHIFDVSTGYPSESGLRSVAVVCKDGLVADALSTTFFVMGYENTVDFLKREQYNIECALISEDANVYMTQGFFDSFTQENGAKNKDGKMYNYIIIK